MAEDQGQKPKFVPARDVVRRGKDGSPPSWAVGIVVVVVVLVVLTFGLGGLDFIYNIIPFARSDWFWIGLIAFPFVTLITVAVLSKGLELHRSKAWAQTAGRIVHSRLETRRHHFQGEPETIENVPVVEYEFNVGAVKYLGSRIGIGDDSGGANAEATLERYTEGATVPVYYDPKDPRNCVLERTGPFAGRSAEGGSAAKPSMLRVIAGLAGLAAFGAAVWWVIARGPDAMAARFPQSNPPFVIFATCFGLAALALFIALHRDAKKAQRWPFVRGKIVRSEVERYEEMRNGSTVAMYRPVVEYAYQVRGRDYRGNQIKLNVAVSGGQGYAERVVKRYPQGGEVAVHYNPARPSSAVLESSAGVTWIVALLALAMFALAASQLGVVK